MRESESQRKLKEVSREHTGSAENSENLIDLRGPNTQTIQGVKESGRKNKKMSMPQNVKTQDLICLLYSDFGIATK